jgi:molybdate transport system substrate-binding protein
MAKFTQFILSLSLGLAVITQSVIASSDADGANNKDASQPLTVAVASNFKYTLEHIIASSDYWSTQNIRLVTGSSGMLYAQIMNGAPFDVFLSADSQRPKDLVNAGLAKSANVYAIGRLVLWPVPLSLSAAASAGTEAERSQYLQASLMAYLSSFEGKLAIANPTLAPFGKAALEVIQSLTALNDLSEHFSDHLSDQLVTGSNVNQAFQFVDSGNAQVGIIAESLLIQARQLLGKDKYNNYMLIPRSLYSNIEQSIVALKPYALNAQRDAFVGFLLSAQTQALLLQYGYEKP